MKPKPKKVSLLVTTVVVLIAVYGPMFIGRDRCLGIVAFMHIAAVLALNAMPLPLDPQDCLGTAPTPWVTPGVRWVRAHCWPGLFFFFSFSPLRVLR